MIKEIRNQEEFEASIQEGRVIVDVYSRICGPCRILGFMLEDLDKEVEDLTILKLNYDRNKEIVAKYKVDAYPTLIFIKDGKEIKRLEGLQQKPILKQLIES